MPRTTPSAHLWPTWSGIGKTAFIIRLLDELQRKHGSNTLSIYTSLPRKLQKDLITFILPHLAFEMKDDEWAQKLAHQAGLPTGTIQKTFELKGKTPIFEISSGQASTLPPDEIPTPISTFQKLIERFCKRDKKCCIVIAIDNLNRQDPDQIRELLDEVEESSKSQASFIFATRQIDLALEIHEQGLVDTFIQLEALNTQMTRLMLWNYLNSGRSDNAKCELDHSAAFAPFNHRAALKLCKESNGVPRNLNRLGFHIMRWAGKEGYNSITPKLLHSGLEYALSQLPPQYVTPEENSTIEAILLEQLPAAEADEIEPILDKSVQLEPLPPRQEERGSGSTPSE